MVRINDKTIKNPLDFVLTGVAISSTNIGNDSLSPQEVYKKELHTEFKLFQEK